MDKPHLLVVGPLPQWDLDALKESYTVHRYWQAESKAKMLADHALDIRAVSTRGDLGADSNLIAALPRLEIIACYGVGVDGIDLAVAKSRGIHVTNTPDVLTDETADMGLALMLAIARRIPSGDRYVREGHWANANMALTTRLSGKRLGIVGLGRIGRAVAIRASAFGMPIAYFSRSSKADVAYEFVPSVKVLAARADFLIATLAGGAGTAKLINRSVLDALGPNGYFINISRGSVVDEPALIEALEQRRIAGAGLDVFLNEPNIDPRFMKLDNVVLQPHQGSATVETRKEMGRIMRENLAAHFAGRPLLMPVT
jgi:D-3-phosphoglycerate dehydrogenase